MVDNGLLAENEVFQSEENVRRGWMEARGCRESSRHMFSRSESLHYEGVMVLI